MNPSSTSSSVGKVDSPRGYQAMPLANRRVLGRRPPWVSSVGGGPVGSSEDVPGGCAGGVSTASSRRVAAH